MPTATPSWNSVRVHGKWVNQDGSMKPGTWKLTMPLRVTNATDDVIIPLGLIGSGSLNVTAGLPSLDIQAPCSDDPDNFPVGVQPVLEVTFLDAPGERYLLDTPVALSGNAGGVDLATVILTDTLPIPAEVFVKGVAGGLAQLDAAGDVVDAAGNKVKGSGAALLVVPTATASATLVSAKHTPVDATSGASTMTLPTTAAAGVLASVEKIDASANAVTITGTLRGATSSIPLTSQFEARTFLSEGSGSWRPISDHRTASSLSATFAVTLGKATADDTARINALLDAARTAGGGVLTGLPGENYQISAPLVVGSGTKLDLSKSVLTLKPSSNSHMVTNYAAYHPKGTATDGAVTSGSNVVTTSLATSAAVGDTVTVYGAGANGFGYLIGNVTSKTATTVTLNKLHGVAANATATVSAAKVVLSPRDKNIRVEIGRAERGANGPNGSTGVEESGVPGHSIYLKHVDTYWVDLGEGNSTAGISFIWPTDCTDGDVWFRKGSMTRTAVQVVGPIYQLRLHKVSGYTPDDLVNLCGNVYPDQTDTNGDVIDVTVGDIFTYGNTNGSALKLNAGQGCAVDRIKVTGRISGITAGTGFLAWIGEDTVYPETTGGQYGTIDLGFLDASGQQNCLILRSADIDSLKVRGKFTQYNPIRVTGANTSRIGLLDVGFDYDHATTTGIILDATGTTIDRMIVRPGRFKATSGALTMVTVSGITIGDLLFDSPVLVPPSTAWQLLKVTTGTVGQVTIRDGYVDYLANTTSHLVQIDGGTVGQIKLLGGYYKGGDTLVRINGGTVAEVYFTSLDTLNGGRLLNLATGSTEVYLDSVRRTTSASAALFANTGATISVRGSGFRASGGVSSELAQVNSTGVVQAFGFALRGDVSKVAKVANGMAFNTNAALSCGVGPVVCDGTNWKHLFTGLTY